MNEKVVTIKFNVDTKDALNNLKEITKHFDDLNCSIQEVKKSLNSILNESNNKNVELDFDKVLEKCINELTLLKY